MGGFRVLTQTPPSACGSINIPGGVWASRAVSRWEGTASCAGEAGGPDLPTWAFEGPVCPPGQAAPEGGSFLLLVHRRPQIRLLGSQVI